MCAINQSQTLPPRFPITVKKAMRIKHLAERLARFRERRCAETACGGSVQIEGEIDLTGIIDGEKHAIPFKDMKVSTPIASMIKTVKSGNELVINEEGGAITNKNTGKIVRLVERQGVYFFRISLKPPHEQVQDDRSRTPGFARPA